jgi:hypothetical protein
MYEGRRVAGVVRWLALGASSAAAAIAWLSGCEILWPVSEFDETVSSRPIGDPGKCADDVQNATETDVDCGGDACKPCGPGKGCLINTDCRGAKCVANRCAPSCTDQVMNDVETDADCGGGTCPVCGPGKGCHVNTDCKGGLCVGNLCAPACNDGVKNALETDVDCGGGTCPVCGAGKGCVANTDCKGGKCEGKQCAPACNDGVKNASETDVDCGGGTCPVCGPGNGCHVNTDCRGGQCVSNQCIPTCTDELKNAAETDVDCGGGACSSCGPEQGCLDNSDCKGGLCTSGKCAPTCTDGVKNGLETDTDCGANCVPAKLCGHNKHCIASADCASNVCQNDPGRCVDCGKLADWRGPSTVHTVGGTGPMVGSLGCWMVYCAGSGCPSNRWLDDSEAPSAATALGDMKFILCDVPAGSVSKAVQFANYRFTDVPAAATIQRVEVLLTRGTSGDTDVTNHLNELHLINAGAAVSGNAGVGDPWPGHMASGVGCRDWSVGWDISPRWAASTVQSTSFGVQVRTRNDYSGAPSSAYIDRALMRAYYCD